MKKLILTCLAAGSLCTAKAQWWGPEAWHGAFWGSWLGGLIGSDCHHGFSGQGAAIGAGVGFLAGALAGEARRQEYYRGAPYYYGGGSYYYQPVASAPPV